MADSDEYESFEVNDLDLEYAMNPNRRRRPTKNQQIYGMWAEREDSDDDRKGFGKSKKSKNYAAPVNFVSGGIKKGSKEVEGEENDEEQPKDSDSDDERPIDLNAFRREPPRPKPNKNQAQVFAGLRGMGAADSASFGGWERHTKGIGLKLLEKMGYKAGQGLGSEGQGIAEPVQAAKRPGRGALGAYGPEVKGPKLKPEQQGAEPGEEEEELPRVRAQWRKEPGRTKVKYKYKTVDEVLAEGGALHARVAGTVGGQHSTKVIDMTGKQQKVYSGYDAFATKTKPLDAGDGASSRKAFDLPELTYNLELLVQMTQEEIVRTDRQLTYLKDQNVALKHDREQMANSIDLEDKQMDRSKQVLELINEFSTLSERSDLTLDHCVELFEKLQQDFYEEYKLFGLNQLAISNVLPLIKNRFDGWNPMSDCERGTETMRQWRAILEEPNSHSASLDHMDAYHRLLWEAWMPGVRRAALDWAPRDQCEQMLRLVECWAPLLPPWMLENWLEQIILPRLQAQVEEWNPLTDTVPIHIWLHPWLSLMGDRLQPVYPPIRHKLSRALGQWHPSDPSAKQILKPWKDVFTPGTMENFLAQNILPKLQHCLDTFVVNPANQKLDVWHWVMVWIDMLSANTMAQLLLRHFFPKWMDALFSWLSCPNPNYEEISQWYSGWKSLFPRQLLDIALVKEQLTIALEMMNRAVSGGGVHRPVPPTAAQGAASVAQHRRDMSLLAGGGSSGAPANFKDLVEKRAVEKGIEFLPVPNKYREAKPVYWFGPVQIYMDRNVLFAQRQPTVWLPVSLEQLITMATR